MKKALKRSLSVLLAITIVFSSALVGLFSVETKAASISDLTFSLCLDADGESYYVTACNESATGSLSIPSTYNGKPVKGIGNWAFHDCESRTSVTIPDVG